MLAVAFAAATTMFVVLPAASSAQGTGGARLDPSFDPTQPADPPTRVVAGSGGARYKTPDRVRPVLSYLRVSRRTLFALGRPVRVLFAIRDRSKYVRVRLEFTREGQRKPVLQAKIGRVRTHTGQVFVWRGTENGKQLRPGNYRIRVIARDSAGNRLARGRTSTAVLRISVQTHRFPIDGTHSFGGPDLRFGASREGHTHRGQDVVASEGTAVVAPRGGTISARGYDALGAGNYLVLDAAGEDFDYVFMHLQTGSLQVSKGDRVATGQMIARVGTTGHSTGPHLHFEIWQGAWFAGGHAIDPFPALKAWDRFS